MTDSATPKPRRIRFVPLAWISGVLAAGLLVLGASGTLSSWTAAILNNNNNTVATTNAVVLQEVATGANPTVYADCQSSNSGFTNTSTCTEINKYGGTTTPLAPGGSQASSVTLTNIGSGPASKLILSAPASSCSQTPAAGSVSTGNPANLCLATATDLNLAVSCVDGSSASATGAYTDLAYNGAASAFTSKTHTATIAKNASITCTFTVSLSATASPLDGGITVTQGLRWELDA
ncbi:hypothetical protein [uncultured Jatrophihabitans sp.]|uniref:hypothetical protein n=1 Tax=uncultured Jatrophihabitans sp. TaxID=1610747 RepID=UPI0035CB5F3F